MDGQGQRTGLRVSQQIVPLPAHPNAQTRFLLLIQRFSPQLRAPLIKGAAAPGTRGRAVNCCSRLCGQRLQGKGGKKKIVIKKIKYRGQDNEGGFFKVGQLPGLSVLCSLGFRTRWGPALGPGLGSGPGL